MPTANITINIGKDPKDYIDVIGKSASYKRSKVKISQKGNQIMTVIEAQDSRALLASIGSVMKQLRIVNNIDNMLESIEKRERQDSKKVKK